MDVKVTRNYSVYQNAVNSGRHAEKSVSVPASADKKMRGDAICISTYQVSAEQIAKRLMSGL